MRTASSNAGDAEVGKKVLSDPGSTQGEGQTARRALWGRAFASGPSLEAAASRYLHSREELTRASGLKRRLQREQ